MYEEIKAEFNEQIELLKGATSDFQRGQITAFQKALCIIQSLPKPSEDLEKEIVNYLRGHFAIENDVSDKELLEIDAELAVETLYIDELVAIARHFAQWQKEQMPVEFGEEDELIFDSILGVVEEWESNQSKKEKEYYGATTKSDWLKTKFKSLRPSLKHSEEQMIPVTALVNKSKDFLSLSLSAEEYAKIGRRFRGGDDIEIYIKQDKK